MKQVLLNDRKSQYGEGLTTKEHVANSCEGRVANLSKALWDDTTGTGTARIEYSENFAPESYIISKTS